MLKLFEENPFFTTIAIVLALVLTVVVRNVDTRFGEILGMKMVFPFVVFCFITILLVVVFIVKLLLPKEDKKEKNRARYLKSRKK